MIIGVHHVQITIPSGQEATGRKFYCELLGLKEIPKSPSLRKKGGFWLELGKVQIHVSIQDDVDRLALKAHVCFFCENLKLWRDKLESAGFKTDDNDPIPGADRFMLRDPFGNRLEFLAES